MNSTARPWLWAELQHLAVDQVGTLWRIHWADDAPLRRRVWAHRGLGDERYFERLGDALDWPDVPPNLEDERAELVDLWADALRCDERGEVLAGFRRGSGV